MSKIVFTGGCFDLLHAGHFNILSFCRYLSRKNGKVILALDSDEKIKKDKGINRPIFDFETRKSSLLELKINNLPIINIVEKFNSNEELYELTKKYNPDILVKGSDWNGNVIGQDIAKKTILFKRISGLSTTSILDIIKSK